MAYDCDNFRLLTKVKVYFNRHLDNRKAFTEYRFLVKRSHWQLTLLRWDLRRSSSVFTVVRGSRRAIRVARSWMWSIPPARTSYFPRCKKRAGEAAPSPPLERLEPPWRGWEIHFLLAIFHFAFTALSSKRLLSERSDSIHDRFTLQQHPTVLASFVWGMLSILSLKYKGRFFHKIISIISIKFYFSPNARWKKISNIYRWEFKYL